MKEITATQSQQVMAALMTECPWSEVDFEKLNLKNTILNNKNLGPLFFEWLKSLPTWWEEDGLIYLTNPITLLGKSSDYWMKRLKSKGYQNPFTSKKLQLEQFLLALDSKSGTRKSQTIVIMKNSLLTKSEKTISNALAEGDRRGFKHGEDLNLEIILSLLDTFSLNDFRQMGIGSVVLMHAAIENRLLYGGYEYNKKIFLVSCIANSERHWDAAGFIFGL